MILNLKILIAKYLLVLPHKIYFLYIKPFKFNISEYPDSFIAAIPKDDLNILNKAPEVIYVFWTGNNPMSQNRVKALDSLKSISDIVVKIITPQNLIEYLLPDFPLHSAYSYLSSVHKSDYLRCYFMLHYGGGYSDVKSTFKSWKKSFMKLNEDPRSWCLGYREMSAGGVPYVDGKIGDDLRRFFYMLIGNGAYIFKPYSPIALEWMNELNNRLNCLEQRLMKNPGNAYGDNKGYPVEWSFLLGQIFHPLVLKYKERVIKDNTIKPQLKNYR